MAVKVLSHDPELDDQIAGEVLWFRLAPLLPPETEQRAFVMAHDDAGVRAANEVPSSRR